MAQVRKAKAAGWRKIGIFLALVVISGAVLGFSNNLQNPFDVFSRTGTFIATGGQSIKPNNTAATATKAASTAPAKTEASKNAQPDASKSSTTPESAAAQANRNNQMQWELFSRVLFNLWFIAATTASVMLIGPFLGLMFKKLRRPTKKPAVARPVRA